MNTSKSVSMFLVLATLLIGCSDPKDIVLGPEPLKQLAEQGEQIKKIPEEERKLLAAYLTANSMGSLFGVNTKSVTGMTIREVLAEAQTWKQQMQAKEIEEKNREKEETALKTKIVAERIEIMNRISSSVIVAVTGKTIQPKDIETGHFDDLLLIEYAVQNKSNKTVIQLKGIITFKDATGDLVGALPIHFDERIMVGKTLKTTTGLGWRISKFENKGIEKIASTELSLMTAHFEPEAIAFDDGEVIKAPDLD